MGQLEIEGVMLIVRLVAEGSRNGLLSLMGVIAASVHLEFSEHMPGECVLFGKHSLNRLVNQVGRFAFQAFGVAFDFLPMIAVVPGVVSSLEFGAGHHYFLSIDNDDKFTGIDMRSVLRPMFPHENHRDLAS